MEEFQKATVRVDYFSVETTAIVYRLHGPSSLSLLLPFSNVQVSVHPYPSNFGNRFATSSHVSSPSTIDLTAAQISSWLALTCVVVSLSRRVMVLSLMVWKSTVMPSGVPSSSFLEYRFPILTDESSVLLATPIRRSL